MVPHRVEVIQHPLVASRLAALRDRSCPRAAFRSLLSQIGALMVPAVTADLETEAIAVETPLEETRGVRLRRPLVLAPILRAGLGLCDGFLPLLPEAAVAHLGFARDEATLEARCYYSRMPPHTGEADYVVIDPMLATGGTACEALRFLAQHGVRRMRLVCVVAAPEGIAHLAAEHPAVPLFTASIDRELNERGYILPGLGDAGDRAFATRE